MDRELRGKMKLPPISLSPLLWAVKISNSATLSAHTSKIGTGSLQRTSEIYHKAQAFIIIIFLLSI